MFIYINGIIDTFRDASMFVYINGIIDTSLHFLCFIM